MATPEQSNPAPTFNPKLLKAGAFMGAVLSIAGVGETMAAHPAAAYEAYADGSVTVSQGDTLWNIVAEQTGAHGNALVHEIQQTAQANHLSNANQIVPGQRLQITRVHDTLPAQNHETTYTLKYGDTLWGRVKQHYGYVTASLVEEVAQRSSINMNHYLPGEVMRFNDADSSQSTAETATQHEAKKGQEPFAVITITGPHQTDWDLAPFIMATYHVSRIEATHMIMDKNPNIDPAKEHVGDHLIFPESEQTLLKQVNYLQKMEALQQAAPRGSGQIPPKASVAAPTTYMVADSIGQGAEQAGLAAKLAAKTQSQVVINADPGRSITHPGSEKHQSALEAVNEDKALIKSAKNIVIELGTNPTDNFAKDLKVLIFEMKLLAPQAQIYVVDIGATRSDTVGVWNERNKVIYQDAGPLGYKVISRAKAVLGPNTDPTNLPAGKDIPGSRDDVHGGNEQLAQAIVNQVGNQSAVPAKPEAAPAPESMPQQVMDYLVAKGYTPAQAAGIVGNMYAESGVQPQRLQNTPNGVTTPADAIPSWKRKQGWGLVQWTPVDKVIDAIKAEGKDPNDPHAQLDFLIEQLSPNGSEHVAGNALRAATTPETAARVFLRLFERPADPAATQQFRMQKARETFSEYNDRIQHVN